MTKGRLSWGVGTLPGGKRMKWRHAFQARLAGVLALLLLVVVGINQTIGYPSPREFGNGLWTIFIGLWLFACFEHVFGLSFRNSWPLFILAWGVKLVFQPLVARRFAHQSALNHPDNKQ